MPGDDTSPPEDASQPALPPADPEAWQPCGEHRYCTQSDVLFWQGRGSMTLEELKVLFAKRHALQCQFGRSFVVVDARQIGEIPAENRRYAIHYRPDPPFRGATVIFGGSVLVRAAVSLITAAARLVGRSSSETASLFFAADVAEAVVVIARQRRLILQADSRT